MTLEDLRVFSTVAAERSFSRAARKLRRTQPAVSQAIRRLEQSAGERLIDRSSRDGTLTDAGRLLLEYSERLLRLSDEASSAVTALREVRKGRLLIGANEGGVYAVLPLLAAFHEHYPEIVIDVRRITSRQMAQEVLLRSVDFGILTFDPPERELSSIVIGVDELVLLVPPNHALAGQRQISMETMGQQTVIAHNDPSPARDHVLRMYEQRHAPLNIRLSLPSLDGIKRAVAMGLGVALLPRRCATGEIARGELVEVHVPELRSPRQVRLIYRREGLLSHASKALLDTARNHAAPERKAKSTKRAARQTYVDPAQPDT